MQELHLSFLCRLLKCFISVVVRWVCWMWMYGTLVDCCVLLLCIPIFAWIVASSPIWGWCWQATGTLLGWPNLTWLACCFELSFWGGFDGVGAFVEGVVRWLIVVSFAFPFVDFFLLRCSHSTQGEKPALSLGGSLLCFSLHLFQTSISSIYVQHILIHIIHIFMPYLHVITPFTTALHLACRMRGARIQP